MTPALALGARVWSDLIDRDLTIVVPVGAVEQHGPHLPVDTDGRIAAELAARAVQAVADQSGADEIDVLLAPTIAYGASGEHEEFPGTVSIGAEVLELLIVEYGRSVCRWASRVVFVNGHGGNAVALASAVRLLRYEGRDAAWWPCVFPGADAHAGDTETSVLLSTSPDDVRADAVEAGVTAPIAELMDDLRAGGVAAVSPSGVLGDPTTADADRGAAMLASRTQALATSLHTWTVRDDGRLV
ncbi:mycofactocin biosynthesis peptidyl-dipeptidase MftE [Gordonia sp. HY442]|uniref:mycofactocin biosynthesis peptidyl-dipeptidase MftE n=1 Tax=Gordonia zhenghanii TaxID=2911516 RepID=UPI001F00178D|nr:mycofactocin biosynthesis peptidyl-dipeptidase MftE [Gordonia zhenghanii]MCF8608026.1 mycofactocin biosynthesis peptidyl-dipeptidase MftE [Gordonia zhenghanii]